MSNVLAMCADNLWSTVWIPRFHPVGPQLALSHKVQQQAELIRQLQKEILRCNAFLPDHVQVHDIEHLRQFARDAVAEVAGLRRSSSGSGLTFGELVRVSSPTNYESALLAQPKMYEQGSHRDRQSERLSPAAVETSQKADERIAMLQQRLDQVRMAFPKYPRLDLRTLTCAHIHRNRL